MTIVPCPVCGKASPHVVCCDCVGLLADIIEQKRVAIVNQAIRDVSNEAEKVFQQDPTKGRGRGPKWLMD